MKYLLLTLLLCLGVYAGNAQDTTAAAVQSTAAGQQLAGISDTLRQVNKKLDSMASELRPGDYYSQSVVDSLMKNAAALYMKPKCAPWIYQVGGWLLFAAILIGGLLLFAYSSICRDESFYPDGRLRPYRERPYSYSRVQLFWWTMIILCCYAAFFALYGQLVPLNMTAVILLGLGATVFAGGRIIDHRQKQDTPAGNRNQDKDSSHDSFMKDILSDDAGVSIHRFQAVVFNLAFGIGFISFFVNAVCAEKYPFITLYEWQFALLGISSATYLGLKAAENNPKTPPPGPAETETEATRQMNLDQNV